jgi:hypothetical protein
MMTLILLTALSGWSYGGFVSDPAREIRPPVLPDAPARPDTGSVPGPTRPSVLPPKTVAPAIAMPPPPRPPTMWRLADSSGQVWEHTDPEWLRRWVEMRNASLRTVVVPSVAPFLYGNGSCANGRCSR